MPAKPRTLTDEEISFEDCRKIKEPVVYAIVHDGRIVYVGKTINPKKRFQNYVNPNLHHNKALRDYMKDNRCAATILHYNPDDLTNAELAEIRERKPEFNVAGLGADFVHKPKPWYAGTGIRCPSDHVMLFAAKGTGFKVKECFADVIKLRERMSDKERCTFETSIYKDAHEAVKMRLQRWFVACSPKMLEVLENG